MTPEKMRVVIAEAMGWEVIPANIVTEFDITGCPPNWGDYGHRYHRVPDYPNDLNAMRGSRVALLPTDELQSEFIERLLDNVSEEDCDINPNRATFMIVNASALEQAEALIRTLGKWEES